MPHNTTLKELAEHFPSLVGATGTAPFDAELLLRWMCTSPSVSSGSAHAAAFVLQVFDPTVNWRNAAVALKLEPRHLPFNAVSAMKVWDEPHRQAFRAWVEHPFFTEPAS